MSDYFELEGFEIALLELDWKKITEIDVIILQQIQAGTIYENTDSNYRYHTPIILIPRINPPRTLRLVNHSNIILVNRSNSTIPRLGERSNSNHRLVAEYRSSEIETRFNWTNEQWDNYYRLRETPDSFNIDFLEVDWESLPDHRDLCDILSNRHSTLLSAVPSLISYSGIYRPQFQLIFGLRSASRLFSERLQVLLAPYMQIFNQIPRHMQNSTRDPRRSLGSLTYL
jgi:hypothetical protein